MVLQNPFPATHVFSQLSALLPGCHPSLPSPPFPRGAANHLVTPAPPVACGLFISLASLLRSRSVYFQSFADSFCKTRGVGVSLVPETLRDSVRFVRHVTFLRDAPARYILRAGFT